MLPYLLFIDKNVASVLYILSIILQFYVLLLQIETSSLCITPVYNMLFPIESCQLQMSCYFGSSDQTSFKKLKRMLQLFVYLTILLLPPSTSLLGLSLICSKIYLLFFQTSQNFYPLFFFIPIAPPIIPFSFYCVSDNITM